MIRGILFDKDGTLVDFFSLWLQAALAVTPAFLEENHIQPDKDMTDYVLRAMGVEDGKVDPRGALAYKSYQEIAADICQALEKKGITLDPARVQEQLERQLELEKARFDQTRRTQQESARQSAQQMADTVLLLRSQLEQVDRQIAEAAERLQRATGAIYTALGETEQNLVTLGAQAESFPKPLSPQPEQPKAHPRPERDKRPPRRPARRRTVSESLLDLLERALKE